MFTFVAAPHYNRQSVLRHAEGCPAAHAGPVPHAEVSLHPVMVTPQRTPVPMRRLTTSMPSRLLVHIATLGPIGHIPFAPGTWGTASGALLLLVLRPSRLSLALAAIALVILGTLAARHAEVHFRAKDPGQVVIDEFAAFLAVMSFLPSTLFSLLLAFALFRFFDIVKPFPIRKIERLFGGGVGVMADDLLAGVYTYASVELCTKLTGSL